MGFNILFSCSLQDRIEFFIFIITFNKFYPCIWMVGRGMHLQNDRLKLIISYLLLLPRPSFSSSPFYFLYLFLVFVKGFVRVIEILPYHHLYMMLAE